MIINSLKFHSDSTKKSMLYSPKFLHFILNPYLALCCIFILFANIVLGQQMQQLNIINTFESTTANISLSGVKFSATDPTKIIALNKDYAPHDYHSETAWILERNPIVSPVAYCSGTIPKLTAGFENCEGETWVKGIGPNGFLAPVQKLIYNSSSHTGRYNYIELVDATTNQPKVFTPNKAQFYEEFVIK